jgi:hypothetical protein
MNRPTPSNYSKWLVTSVFAMGLSGCITYTGDYANDGYYSSPDRYASYDPGYYGDYYYSAVPSISISNNFYFGIPFYSYYRCNYWSPYCGGFYPGYGYAYGPGYGFGWGHGPYYGYQEPHHHHKPKPPRDKPAPPDSGVGQPVVQKPVRSYPGYVLRGQPILKAQTPTPPVSTGASNPAINVPSATDETQKTSYWRIPQNQQRRQGEPIVRRSAPQQREDLQTDGDYVRVERATDKGNTQIRVSNPMPIAAPVTQVSPSDTPPERQQRKPDREPKQARGTPIHKKTVENDGDP